MSENNEFISSPRILKPTLVEFLKDDYLLDELKNPVDMENKVTVIQAPPDWFNLYFDESTLQNSLSNITIKHITKQTFTKTGENNAYLYTSEKFMENNTKKHKNKDYSVEEYQQLSNNYGVKNVSEVISEKNHVDFLNSDNPTTLFAADIDFSMFQAYKGNKNWNLLKLKSFLTRILDKRTKKVQGVHTPYVYIGSAGSTFPCHVEDGHLLSINIHFLGADKIWFIINKKNGNDFHELTNKILKNSYPDLTCSNLMGHKLLVLNEQFLIDNKIHYTKVIQKPGTIVVTHPFAWNFGLNCGFNVNEEVNFANSQSLKYLCNAKTCNCDDLVQLNATKVINEKYPTFYKNEAIHGNPDNHKVIEKKKKKQLANLEKARNTLNEKKTKLTTSTIQHWLNFTLKYNPYPHLKYPNEKLVAAFKIYCKKEKHVLLDYENCKFTQFKSRVVKQIYKPIIEGKNDFDLSKKDLKTISDKFKK